MSDLRGYLDAIRCNPIADEPRLALADWLLGHTDEIQRAREGPRGRGRWRSRVSCREHESRSEDQV